MLLVVHWKYYYIKYNLKRVRSHNNITYPPYRRIMYFLYVFVYQTLHANAS